MRECGYTKPAFKESKDLIFKGEALLKTAKDQTAPFFIKPIGTTKCPTGLERPSILIISSLKDSLPGKAFISHIVVDDRNSALSPYVLIIFKSIVFSVGNVDFHLTLMMLVDLIVIFAHKKARHHRKQGERQKVQPLVLSHPLGNVHLDIQYKPSNSNFEIRVKQNLYFT